MRELLAMQSLLSKVRKVNWEGRSGDEQSDLCAFLLLGVATHSGCTCVREATITYLPAGCLQAVYDSQFLASSPTDYACW